MDIKDEVIAIFFDFAKDFDLVDHEVLLLTKLDKNLPTWLISWLATYLTNRQQRVVILNNTNMEIVPSYKYLGVQLNSNLNWNEQWLHVQKQTSKYNILPIADYIDLTCTKIMKRILGNNNHSITAKITKSTRNSSLKPNKAKTSNYANSIVQRFIRTLRDGSENLYTHRSIDNYNTVKTSLKRKPPTS